MDQTQPKVGARSSAPDRSCQRWVLANGLTVVVTENPVAELIAARLFVRGGSLTETTTTAGLAHLLAATLPLGTTTQTPWEIATQIEAMGATLNVQAAPDYWLLSLKTIAPDFEPMLALAATLLQSPIFPETEVARSRHSLLQELHLRQQQPFMVAMQTLRQTLYPQHPYAHATPHDAAVLAQLTRADVQQAHQTYFRPDQTVISIAGRVKAATALGWVQHYFGAWPRPTPPISVPRYHPKPQRLSHRLIPLPGAQVVAMIGDLAAAAHEADYVPLKVLHTYLCNGLSSRLGTELREKRGLVYDVSGFYPTRLDRSHWVTHLTTTPHQAKLTLTLLQSELERLQQPLSDDEVVLAQRKLLGQYALGKQTNMQMAHLVGWYECLGLGAGYDATFQAQVQATTPDLLHAAAQRWLPHPTRVVVGPERLLSDLK